MSDRRFTLDTNVLVYALDRQAGERHVIAREIVTRAAFVDCCLTLQAIAEFFSAVTRKRVVAVADAAAQAEDWLAMFRTVAASASAVRAALAMAVAGRASYWDALLLTTAAEAGCATILTEDLADGALLSGVRIVNPFAGGRLAPAADSLLTPG